MTTPSAEMLKACPFCGYDKISVYEDADKYWKAMCGKCCAKLAYSNEHLVIQAWNQRPTPANEWMEISTAPKDGTIILVSGGIAYWREKEQAWFTLTAEAYPGRPIQWEVTHWMPLPNPPAERKEKT